MTIFLFISIATLSAYAVVMAKKYGVPTSLSASYYMIKRGWAFQIALGVIGFSAMVYLLDANAGMWYQFISFFATAALIFVAFSPDYKQMLEGKVHGVAAIISAVASVLLTVSMGCWYVPAVVFTIFAPFIKKSKNRVFWAEMACFGSMYLSLMLKLIS